MIRRKPKVYFKHGLWWMLHGMWLVQNSLTKTWVEQMNIRLHMIEKAELRKYEVVKHIDVMYQGVMRRIPVATGGSGGPR